MTILIEPWLAKYLDGVFARQREAMDVPRKKVRYADGSAPHRSYCHDNVDRWVLENPDCRAVRGWMISARMGEAVMLEAHTVVREADGSLIDITLEAADQRAPFIPHIGRDEEFTAARNVVNQISWSLSR